MIQACLNAVMGRVLARTWFPTIFFVPAMSAIGWVLGGGAWGQIVALSALVITPLLWWGLVARFERVGPGRGALGGALTGACTHLAPLLLGLVWFYAMQNDRQRAAGGLGLLSGFLGVVMILAGAVIAAIFGAVLGAFLTRSRRN